VQKTNIKNVQVKPDRMLITLADKVYLYSLPLSDQFKSFDTVNNPYGVSAFASDKLAHIAAIPGEDQPGSLVVVNYATDTLMCMIEGDQDEEFYVTQLALNSTGTVLASATSEGCTIHLYNTSDGSLLKNFTRSTTPSTINFLKFQLDDSRLLVSSEAGTLHIFLVKEGEPAAPQNHTSYFSFLGGIIPYLGKIGSY
jgi:autophagy-related protein 18